MADQFDNAIQYYENAVRLYRKQEFDKAIDFAKMAISIIPDLAPAYNVKGNAHYGKGEYDEAIEAQTFAIKFNEEAFQRKISESGNSKTNEMLNNWKKIKAVYYFNRGNAYDDNNDFENAEKDFSEAIKINPKFANAYNSRGTIHIKNGNYINAIDDFTKAIQNNYEKLPFVYQNRSHAFLHLKKYEEAISDCQKAIEIDPFYAHTYNTLGIIYAAMGDYDNARLSYEKAIKIEPNYREPKNNLKLLGQKPTEYETFSSVELGPLK